MRGDSRFYNLRLFIIKLNKLTNTQRLLYLKTITPDEIDLISEIALNFLNLNIKTDTRSYILLKRLKTVIKCLASKLQSYNSKRKILKSLRGVQMLNILLPLVSITLNIIK